MEQARALYEAPFVVASHGTGEDPVFNYANRAALTLFETGWPDFVSTPSRLSAEPIERAQRAQLLASVRRRGFIDVSRLPAAAPPAGASASTVPRYGMSWMQVVRRQARP